MVAQLGSFSVPLNAHHWHCGLFGPVVVGFFGSIGASHALVPRGSCPVVENVLFMFRVSQPRPPSHIGSLQLSSSSVLVIDFPESLDAALLLRFIDVVDPAGKPVRGKVSLDNEEKRWIFSPDIAWQPGKYTLEVLSTLEDLAGNKIGRSVDADRAGQAPQTPVGESVTIPFEIAQ